MWWTKYYVNGRPVRESTGPRRKRRRTAVRNLERRGVARSVAMKITGHKTESVYRRYAIVSDADLQEATRKLAGTIAGTVEGSGVDSVSVSAHRS